MDILLLLNHNSLLLNLHLYSTLMEKKPLPLHWKIIIGLILGIIWAIIASFAGLADFNIKWLDPFGVIFINLLKLIAVPLVLFSIISGVVSMGDATALGKIGLKTLAWYLCSIVFAITIGLVIVNLVGPGKTLDQETRLDNRIKYELWAQENNVKVKDGKCFSCLPENQERVKEITGFMQTELTEANISKSISSAQQVKEEGPLQPLVDMFPENVFFSLSNNSLMLQVIIFAIFFGICIILLPEENMAPLKSVILSANDVFLKMVDIIMKGAPFFVFALLAGTISKIAGNDPHKVVEIFKGLGWYSLCVVAGLAVMLFLVYPVVVKLWTKKISYMDFMKGMSAAQTLAFSTSSSAATLPVTFECVEKNLKVDHKISSFVLPIGATVNMDGTSLYQAVATVFLAQFHLIDLDLSQQLIIVLTATLASIGTAAVPSAGLVMLIIVLESVGLNPAWIAIIFPVDRILDMCRTIINVTGDAAVSVIIADSENMLYFDKDNPSPEAI